MSGSAHRQQAEPCQVQASSEVSQHLGADGGAARQGHSEHRPQPPRTPRCHARPTVSVFVAGLTMLRRDGGTGLTVRGAFTAVELSHWRWPWQVFNDLDFNWMGGGGGWERERKRKRERKDLEKTVSNTRPTEKESSCGGKDPKTKIPVSATPAWPSCPLP